MSVEQFPTSAAYRLDTLRATLRPVDTGGMSTPEVVALCEAELADCTIDEIIQALQQVAEEHHQEAEQLRQLKARRGEGEP